MAMSFERWLSSGYVYTVVNWDEWGDIWRAASQHPDTLYIHRIN